MFGLWVGLLLLLRSMLRLNLISIFSGFVPSYGLAAIGWKFYMINGCYDVLQVIYVAVYWVETKGLTLEEIDRVMDGKKAKIHDIEGVSEVRSIEGFEVDDSASGIRMRSKTGAEKTSNVVDFKDVE